eukprot:gene1371-1390_t
MILDSILEHARRQPDHAALIYNDLTISYRNLFRMVEGVRQALLPLELPQDARAVLCIDGTADALIVMLALRGLGVTTVAVPDLQNLATLALGPVSLVITSAREPHHEAYLTAAVQNCPHFSLGLELLHAALATEAFDAQVPQACAAGHLLQTSGTTAAPKKILLDDETLALRCKKRAELLSLTGSSVFFSPGRGIWTQPGIIFPLAVWLRGATFAVSQGDDRYTAFQNEAVTHAHFGAATLAVIVAALPPGLPPRPELRITTGGTALADSVVSAVHHNITGHLTEIVGTTESDPFLVGSASPGDWPRRFSVIEGRKVIVAHPDGTEAARGEVGELRVRIEDAVTEYLDDPITSERVFRNGWCITGDLATMDANGFVTLHGRATEVLNLAVGKLAIVPLEQGIRDRLGIRQVCLVQSAFIATELHLFLESESTLSTQAVGGAVAEFLGGLGRVSVHVVAALPINRSGKLDRSAYGDYWRAFTVAYQNGKPTELRDKRIQNKDEKTLRHLTKSWPARGKPQMHINLSSMPLLGLVHRRAATLAAATALSFALPSAGQANELGGNSGYQFQSAQERSVAAANADLVQKYGGGYYQQWHTTNNYTYNTNNTSTSVINGNQVNCTLSSSATGNAGTTSGYASTASPQVSSAPGVSSSALGNSSSGATSGSSGTLAAPLNSVQSSYGSPVGSAVTGTVSSAGVGQLSTGYSSSTQALNSNQSATASPSTSLISNSSACSGPGLGATAVSTAPTRASLSGCANFTYRQQGPESAPIIRGPAITNNSTLLEPLYACYRDALMASQKGGEPISVGVGEVRDYTGKSSINEGAAMTQGGTLMVMSALGRVSPAVRLHERFDPRVGELELIYADRRQLGDGRAYGVPGPNGQMQRVPWLPYAGGTIMNSRYFIVGGITELNWNVQSAGLDARIDGAGPAARTFTASIAADLRIVDTRTLVVVRTVSLQKQVTGHEVDVNIFRFIGNRLFDISGGTKNQEPLQLAVRATLEMGVLELLASVSGVSYEPCAKSAVDAGMLSSTFDLSTPRTAPVIPAPPFAPQPLPADAPQPGAPAAAEQGASRAAPRSAVRSAPLPASSPQANRPDAAMRPPIPSFLSGPQMLPAPGSLSQPSSGQRPAILTDPSGYPDPQRQPPPAIETPGQPRTSAAPAPQAPAPNAALAPVASPKAELKPAVLAPEVTVSDPAAPAPKRPVQTLGEMSPPTKSDGAVAKQSLFTQLMDRIRPASAAKKQIADERASFAMALPF